MNADHELVIIGGGPAGLSASIYAGRSRLDSLLIEKDLIGGRVVNAELIENYPGFPQGISGLDLAEAMHQQAKKFGVGQLEAEVEKVSVEEPNKVIHLKGGQVLRARAVTVAGGLDPTKLGVPGEDAFTGKGVSFCATCDGPLFSDRRVVVVGGGDSAVSEAIFLTRFASKVMLIHRRDQLRASKILQEKALSNPKIEFLWNTIIEEINGDELMRSLKLKRVDTGEKSVLEAEGVFIYAGLRPNTDCIRSLLTLDKAGNIVANELMETSVPGVFAAGDLRHNSGRQAILSAGDGAMAALSAERFLHGP